MDPVSQDARGSISRNGTANLLANGAFAAEFPRSMNKTQDLHSLQRLCPSVDPFNSPYALLLHASRSLSINCRNLIVWLTIPSRATASKSLSYGFTDTLLCAAAVRKFNLTNLPDEPVQMLETKRYAHYAGESNIIDRRRLTVRLHDHVMGVAARNANDHEHKSSNSIGARHLYFCKYSPAAEIPIREPSTVDATILEYIYVTRRPSVSSAGIYAGGKAFAGRTMENLTGLSIVCDCVSYPKKYSERMESRRAGQAPTPLDSGTSNLIFNLADTQAYEERRAQHGNTHPQHWTLRS